MSHTQQTPEEMSNEELVESIANWDEDLEIVAICQRALDSDHEL